MKRILILLALVVPTLLAACGKSTPAPTPTQTITSTPDPCSSSNVPGEAAKVNKLMREFDDYSSLASNTPQSQLVILIPQMQRILRDAEDQPVPACLQTLKKLQLTHMNTVVQTLMAFMTSKDVKVINAGIGQARDLHNQYDIEMARLLGVTLVVQPSPTAGAATAQSNPASSPTPQAAFVAIRGPSGVNLRSAPSLEAPEAGLLNAQSSTAALGRSADGQWIKVEIPGQPGQTAWVYAPLVQLSVPIEQLPIVQ